jgi:glycosyltransferase involved in cell wall biosynthesis
MDFTQKSFPQFDRIEIPKNAQVIWVSDLFVEDYVGGAELTSEALIQSSPLNVFKLHSKDVTMDLLQEAQDKFWVFGNFFNLDLNIIPAIVVNMKYSIIEYDYKFCKYRSPEKHEMQEKNPCNCASEDHGKLIAAFYLGSKHLWWMSEKQMEIYHAKFPALKENKNTVLSSVFDDKTLATIKLLRENAKEKTRKGWIVLGSNSWIKGFEDAKDYCENNDLDYKVLWNVPYEVVLQELSEAEGHVYLPRGGDTCPRMVIESRLLGTKLILNDFVQHKDEEWFNPKADKDDADDEITQIEQYLYAARDWFWNGVKSDIDYVPTISGYTTTRNCISQNYPFESTILSLLDFCDEVVVMDGGSSDGTYQLLKEWEQKEPKLKIYSAEMDWDSKRFALFDGMLKSMAREKCTMDFCWQSDSDETIHEDDIEKIHKLVKNFPSNVDLLALPVVEYWGGKDKVRMDINPWKWRLSRNKSYIGHGVPGYLRVIDGNEYYSKMGSDGCDLIHRETLELIPFANFYTAEHELARRQALKGDLIKENYQTWFNLVVENLPCVYHFSWWNIERKIKTYKNYWQRHWESLFNIKTEDNSENNKFFDKPWSEVSDEEIKQKAIELSEKTGGWIFHEKWNGQTLPHLTIEKDLPKYIKNWV